MKNLIVEQNFTYSNVQIETLFQSICNDIVDKLGFHGSAVFTYDERQQAIFSKTFSQSSYYNLVNKVIRKPFDSLSVSTSESNNLIVKAFIEGKDFEDNSLSSFIYPTVDQFKSKIIQTVTGAKNFLSTPIFYNGKIIGVILVSKDKKTSFKHDKLIIQKFLTESATQFNNALTLDHEKKKVYGLTEENSNLKIINNFINKIIDSLDEGEIAQKALDSVSEFFPYTGALYITVDYDREILKFLKFSSNKDFSSINSFIEFNPTDYYIKIDDDRFEDNINIRALKTGEVCITDNFHNLTGDLINNNAIEKIQKILNMQSIIAVPIKVKGKVTSIINFIIDNKIPSEISESDLNMMQIISSNMGLVMRNALLHSQTEKTVKELQRVNEREKDLIDVISHELKSPITVSRGNLELLLRDLKELNLNDHQINVLSKKINSAHEAVLRESSIVKSLLAATTLENGQLVIINHEVDVVQIIIDVVRIYKQQADDKNIKLTFKPPENFPKINVDKVRIDEVIDNLISNALKFTKSGKITVSLKKNKEYIIFSVKDTGCGIHEENIFDLFKKFHRINNPQAGRIEGSGLGLYISKGIIEAHNGRIWVESKGLSKGSTFKFCIPIKDCM